MQNRIAGVVEASRLPIFLASEGILTKLEAREEVEGKKEEKEGIKDETPKQADMISHGFGVMEDHNGDIWYSENGFIYKNATNSEDKTVRRWLSKDH